MYHELDSGAQQQQQNMRFITDNEILSNVTESTFHILIHSTRNQKGTYITIVPWGKRKMFIKNLEEKQERENSDMLSCNARQQEL
jgi:hypothetical protein